MLSARRYETLITVLLSLMHRGQLLLADELRELVKGFVARLELDGSGYKVTTSSEARWTTTLRWCPRELLDLVNSKACRGTYAWTAGSHRCF